MAQNHSSNIFIEVSEAAKQKNYQSFNYPLQCVFERRGYDPLSRTYDVVDYLNVNLQQGSLTDGVNLHLTPMEKSTQEYKLNVKIVDNQGVHLKSTQWLWLTKTGLVNVDCPPEFNTLSVDVN